MNSSYFLYHILVNLFCVKMLQYICLIVGIMYVGTDVQE